MLLECINEEEWVLYRLKHSSAPTPSKLSGNDSHIEERWMIKGKDFEEWIIEKRTINTIQMQLSGKWQGLAEWSWNN